MGAWVDWPNMRALQAVLFAVGMFAFDIRLLKLVACTSLQRISFSQVVPYDAESAKFLAGLTGALAVKRQMWFVVLTASIYQTCCWRTNVLMSCQVYSRSALPLMSLLA